MTAERLGELVALIGRGEITGKLAKEIFPKCFRAARPPAVIIEREGLKQISDDRALEIIDDVMQRTRSKWSNIEAGRHGDRVPGRQVMKASRGQADPAAVNRLLKEKL